jgi:hypothetical protein
MAVVTITIQPPTPTDQVTGGTITWSDQGIDTEVQIAPTIVSLAFTTASDGDTVTAEGFWTNVVGNGPVSNLETVVVPEQPPTGVPAAMVLTGISATP